MNKNTIKYSIVIPTYNHCDDLLKPCIETIFKYSSMAEVELIVSANGCVDNTKLYLNTLRMQFDMLGFSENFKMVWHDKALGYSRACNEGIKLATTDKIVLLNNDILLLEQSRHAWLELLDAPFDVNPKCGVTCVVKGPSAPAGRDFAIFFCVMIHRKVFEKIGLLNEEYGVGGGEDTEFCIEAEDAGFEVCVALETQWNKNIGMHTGNFPIYHKGEGTVHDASLVPNWNDVFDENSLRLAKKYNPKWYQWRLSNHWERAVFFKGDPVASREVTRYTWAAQHLVGNRVFELGCSSGYGIQFLPKDITYTGLDYDKYVIEAAREQGWEYNAQFVHADINTYKLEQYDTIIAFEVIEHLENGLEIVEKLKQHCKRLMITVPMLEPPGKWGPHHKLHLLDEQHFPGFKIWYIAPDGRLLDAPHNRGDTENINLMLCIWDNEAPQPEKKTLTTLQVPLSNKHRAISPIQYFQYMKDDNYGVFYEVIENNCYRAGDVLLNMNVLDIGANIGCYSLLASYYGAKKVVAVEPVADTFNYLVKNIAASGFKNITPVKNIVWSEDDVQQKIVTSGSHNGINGLYMSGEKHEYVKTITLAKLLQQFDNDPVVLKLDCEGSEYDIILNASQDEMNRIPYIHVEIHTQDHPRYKGYQIMADKLRSFGYKQEYSFQMYAWDVDSAGNKFNYRPLETMQEGWSR